MYRRDVRDTGLDGLLADLATVDGVVQASPGPNGRIAYVKNREDRTDLWVLDDGDDRRLTSEGVIAMRYGRTDAQWLDWSPDGDRIAVVTGECELATVDVRAGSVDVLTDWDGGIAGLAWGEPGIAVVTDQFSRASLAVVEPDGTGVDVRADDEFLYGDPRWDGDAVVAARSIHRHFFDFQASVVRVDAEGDVETLFAEECVRAACPRPRPGTEGELAVVHDGTGFDAIYALDADDPGGDPVRLYAVDDAEVADPRWDADGDRLAVTVTRDGRAGVHEVVVDGPAVEGETTPREVATDDAVHGGPRWDVHGDRLLAVRDAPTEPPAVVDAESGVRLTPSTTAGLTDRLPEPEAFTYDSGGLEIHAMIHLPDGDADPDSLPLIVNPHGGPTTYDGFDFDYRAAYFAALGYAVVRPNYRGSDGFGRAFRMANDDDWGGGDLEDVIAAADAAAARYDAIDGDRVGIFGGSGGGLMTVNALGTADRFRCGAALYGVYDYETFVDDTDDVGWQLMKRELGDLVEDLENYREASPIRTVPDIEDPLLVLHGEEDDRVPISQSEQLVAELETHDVRHEFRRYDGEPHGFGRLDTVVDAYTRIADLFAKYLRRYPDDGTSRPYEPPADDRA
ncbi:prolyl oligopeptidase family serine peptidase [Halovivax sp.]|uniref:S9 family peptidase n=1 Tax=Halovivax sp. TaxID=1935978 RepID=UPI0025BF40C3|nr:prolyl oligopeptidase family serine peptidase [Halovivax sp.]